MCLLREIIANDGLGWTSKVAFKLPRAVAAMTLAHEIHKKSLTVICAWYYLWHRSRTGVENVSHRRLFVQIQRAEGRK
jgi:hypothetical protein